jgi:hypothetical protein
MPNIGASNQGRKTANLSPFGSKSKAPSIFIEQTAQQSKMEKRSKIECPRTRTIVPGVGLPET